MSQVWTRLALQKTIGLSLRRIFVEREPIRMQHPTPGLGDGCEGRSRHRNHVLIWQARPRLGDAGILILETVGVAHIPFEYRGSRRTWIDTDR
jgi:hypothetical protein